MDSQKTTLNLDELFGQAKSVSVVHDGRSYAFMKLEAMTPRHAVTLQRMQTRVAALQKAGDEITEAQGDEIEGALDEMICLLCPSFPIGEIVFAKKMRIIMFYMESQEKKAVETALRKMTGAKRSRK